MGRLQDNIHLPLTLWIPLDLLIHLTQADLELTVAQADLQIKQSSYFGLLCSFFFLILFCVYECAPHM